MSTRGINIPMDIGASVTGDASMIGKTGNNTEMEDSPSSPSPARIVGIRNVLPTELGYHSAFSLASVSGWTGTFWGESYYFTRVGETRQTSNFPDLGKVINKLKESRTQQVISFETPERRRVFVMLAEMGVYLVNAHQLEPTTGGHDYDPLNLVEIVETFPQAEELFRLWTTAVIDGILYCYRQGDSEVYIVGDKGVAHQLAQHEDIEFRSVFSTEESLLEILAAKPTFLNMEGQVGIFKANNRLGFWDSDGSVAWSSAFIKLDFKPDVVSMAGITRFASVSGDIINVLPTVAGFIIYSTSSIVRVTPLHGSEERWSGTTILAKIGITYNTHATSGADEDIHYAWTPEGIYRIAPEGAEQIMVEEFRAWTETALSESPKLFRLTAIGENYLMVSEAKSWTARPVDTQLRIGVVKGDDRDYPFYLPKVQPYIPDRFWGDFLNGAFDQFPDFLDGEEWDVEPDGHPPLEDLTALAPCFTGYRYRTPGWLINVRTKSEPGVTGSLSLTDSIPLIVEEGDEPVYASIQINDLKAHTAPLEGYTAVSTLPLDWRARQESSRNEPRQVIDLAGNALIEVIEQVERDYYADVEPFWERLRGTYRARTVPLDNGIYRPSDNSYGYPVILMNSTKQLLEGYVANDWDKRPFYNSDPWDGTMETHFEHLEDIDLTITGVPAITARAAVPPEQQSAFVIPPPQPLVGGTQMSPEAYEYYRVAIRESTPLGTNHVRLREMSAGKNLPFPDVPLVRVFDDCSLGIYALVDEIILVEEFAATLDYLEEASQRSHRTVTASDVSIDKVTEIKNSSGEVVRWEYETSIPIDDATWTEVAPIPKGVMQILGDPIGFEKYGKTTITTHVYVDPNEADMRIQRAVLGQQYVSTSGEQPSFQVLGWPNDSINPAVEWQYNHVLVSSSVKAIPASFRGKTLEQINHMLDPANVKDYPEIWVPIFEVELSGYGFFGNTSATRDRFTKTISKARLWLTNPEGECKPKNRPQHITLPTGTFTPFKPNINDFGLGVVPHLPYESDRARSPNNGNLPDRWPDYSLPRDLHFSARFRKGTVAPYYPVYEKAWVYDLQLEKWGSMDWLHTLIFQLAPVNPLGSSAVIERVDWSRRGNEDARLLPMGILPGMYAPLGLTEYSWRSLWDTVTRSLMPWAKGNWKYQATKYGRHVGMPTLLTSTSNTGKLEIETIALSRDGYTKMVGLTGKTIYDGRVYVEASEQGQEFGHRLWNGSDTWGHQPLRARYAEYMSNAYTVDFRFPFVLVGKEFKLTIEGAFAVDKLICYGKSVGSLRFFGTSGCGSC